MRSRGVCKSSLPLLNTDQLDQLYHHFIPKSQGSYRYTDHLFLGLMIYQAVDEQDFLRINYEDLNLSAGTLNVSGGLKRKSGRKLPLASHQIIPFQHYLSVHRKKGILLFYPQCKTFIRLHDQFKSLSKQVKYLSAALGINFICFNQLRQSRFTQWIRSYGLRKAQYLAGFKCVSTMEVYRQQDTTDLWEYVKKYHPFQ